jgi:hypothetical protein
MQTRALAYQSLSEWATDQAVPTLLEGLNARNPLIKSVCFRGCARFPRPDVAKAVAGFLDELNCSDAEQSLKQMGPVAEEAVLPYLDSGGITLQRACHVLAAVGTSASLPKLEPLRQHTSPTVRAVAEAAVEAIQARTSR